MGGGGHWKHSYKANTTKLSYHRNLNCVSMHIFEVQNPKICIETQFKFLWFWPSKTSLCDSMMLILAAREILYTGALKLDPSRFKEMCFLPLSIDLSTTVRGHMLTRQMLTRQMLTRQMLTRQMLTTLMEKETFAHNCFYNLYL